MRETISNVLIAWGIWVVAWGIAFLIIASVISWLTFFNVPSGDISDAMRWGVYTSAFLTWGWIVLVVGVIISTVIALRG